MNERQAYEDWLRSEGLVMDGDLSDVNHVGYVNKETKETKELKVKPEVRKEGDQVTTYLHPQD